MKQYTTSDQTAKLIELGFEKPKFEVEAQMCNMKGQPLRVATIVGDYSIGELIEMLRCLPMAIDISGECVVTNNPGRGYGIYTQSKELIDALFEQIVKLKEMGVI